MKQTTSCSFCGWSKHDHDFQEPGLSDEKIREMLAKKTNAYSRKEGYTIALARCPGFTPKDSHPKKDDDERGPRPEDLN